MELEIPMDVVIPPINIQLVLESDPPRSGVRVREPTAHLVRSSEGLQQKQTIIIVTIMDTDNITLIITNNH